MEINQKFFIDYITENFDNPKEIKVLDFGCGDGQIVKKMRGKGFQFYGVENYYDGDKEYLKYYKAENEFIKRYTPPQEKIPFPDNYFDFIYSNQVFEHVVELDFVLKELYRILKKNGVMVHNFPLKEYFMEGHFRIPIIHWFQNFNFREKLTLTLIRFGFGIHKGNYTMQEYCNHVWDFIENRTKYRTQKEIMNNFTKYFLIVRYDKKKLLYHLKNRASFVRYFTYIVKIIPSFLVNIIEKRRGSITILARKIV